MSILENYEMKNYSGKDEGVVGCSPASLQAALEDMELSATDIITKCDELEAMKTTLTTGTVWEGDKTVEFSTKFGAVVENAMQISDMAKSFKEGLDELRTAYLNLDSTN